MCQYLEMVSSGVDSMDYSDVRGANSTPGLKISIFYFLSNNLVHLLLFIPC